MMGKDNRKSALAYACLEMAQYKHKRFQELSPFFLRKAYSGTSAEVKDDTQEKLHEYDWRK